MTKSELDPRDALRGCLIHIRQTSDAIDEATKQRSDHVAAGDLDLVRRTTKRITDLKSDLAALEEGRALLEARVAGLDTEQRIAACDTAADELKPSLEGVCGAIERLEEALLAAAAAHANVLAAYAAFGEARQAHDAALPRVPNWRAGFTLETFRARLTDLLEDCARWGLDRITPAALQRHDDRRWSATHRVRASAYVDDLKSAVREIEAERAAEDAKAHV
jgi:hypothetical protein